MQKIYYLGWWPSLQGVNLTPHWSHVENRLPCLPQATGLTPFPSQSPLIKPTSHTFDTILLGKTTSAHRMSSSSITVTSDHFESYLVKALEVIYAPSQTDKSETFQMERQNVVSRKPPNEYTVATRCGNIL